MIKDTYNQFGLRGYWKGVTASYLGITETVIHFVIYEAIKKQILANKGHYYDNERSASDFAVFMIAAACSKTCATCIAYPHGEDTNMNRIYKVMIVNEVNLYLLGLSVAQDEVI